jgi:hypothetical protein
MPAGQPIIQSSTVTPGHVGTWTTDGVLQDAGPGTEGAATEFGITANGGVPFAISSANPPNPYVQYGVGVASTGVITQYFESYGGAPAASVFYNINGVTYAFNPAGNGNITGPTSSVNNDIVTFNGTGGNLVQDSGVSVTALLSNQFPSIANVAALEAATSTTLSQTSIYLLGYYTTSDGGGGIFNVGATTTANGGTIINDASGRSWHRLATGTQYSVKWFGAKGDSATNDTTAILATIAAAQVVGGIDVFFPFGNYVYSTTLAIGNGGVGVVSKLPGVRLIGATLPSIAFWYTVPPCTSLIWAGGAAAMITVNGPLQGWGVQNLYLNGENVATYGIYVSSGSFGDNSNVFVGGCVAEAIASTTVPTFGGATNTDSIHNKWRGITVAVGGAASAKGVVLTGESGGSSNTDYNSFTDLMIVLPATGVSYALYLQNCDTNTFINTQITGGSASAIGVLFDYTGVASSQWPSSNSFYGIDPNGAVLGTNQFVNNGNPGNLSRPNYIFGLNEDNGSTFPDIGNLVPGLPLKVGGILSEGLTGSVAGTNLYLPYAPVGTYRVSLYLTITNTGNNVTVLASIGWIDPTTRSVSTLPINFSSGVNEPQSLVECIICTNTGGGGISYSTTVSGAVGSGQYSLSITVERLS